MCCLQIFEIFIDQTMEINHEDFCATLIWLSIWIKPTAVCRSPGFDFCWWRATMFLLVFRIYLWPLIAKGRISWRSSKKYGWCAQIIRFEVFRLSYMIYYRIDIRFEVSSIWVATYLRKLARTFTKVSWSLWRIF